MRIVLKGDEPRWVPALGLTVEPGAPVSCSEEVGASLVSQSEVWAEVKAPKKEVDT